MLGVKRVQNLWSCNDRKGYSPEDKQFHNSILLCHNCPTHFSHKCPTHEVINTPIPMSPSCLTSHFMGVQIFHLVHWCASQCWCSPTRPTTSVQHSLVQLPHTAFKHLVYIYYAQMNYLIYAWCQFMWSISSTSICLCTICFTWHALKKCKLKVLIICAIFRCAFLRPLWLLLCMMRGCQPFSQLFYSTVNKLQNK